MQRQTAQAGQGLAGTERYGTVHGTETRQLIPAHIQPGVEPATPSGVRYGIKAQCSFVKKDGDQCLAPKKGDSKYCVGHTRHILKLQAQQEKEEASGQQEQ